MRRRRLRRWLSGSDEVAAVELFCHDTCLAARLTAPKRPTSRREVQGNHSHPEGPEHAARAIEGASGRSPPAGYQQSRPRRGTCNSDWQGGEEHGFTHNGEVEKRQARQQDRVVQPDQHSTTGRNPGLTGQASPWRSGRTEPDGQQRECP